MHGSRRDQASALWRPSVSLGATAGIAISETATSGAQFSAPGFGQSNGVAFNTSINHGATGRLAISARQPLISGEREAQRRQLELGAEAATADLLAAEQSMGLRVAEAYFNLVEAVESDRVLRRQKVAVDRALAQVRERFQLGDVPITDTHEAAARAEAVKAQLLATEADIEVKRAALVDITALPFAGLNVLPPTGALSLVTLPTLDEALAAAAAGNPQIRARTTGMDVAKQEVEKLASGAATSVDLVAQLGRDRIAGSGDFGSASNSATNGLVGVQVSVPLFTGGYRSARQQEAVFLVEKARAELQRLRQQVGLQTRAAWLGLTVGRGRIDALAETLKATNARLDATRLGREVGDRTTLDLLNAENDAANAELGLLRARIGLLMDRLRLAALSGSIDEQLVGVVNASLGTPGLR